MKKILVIIVVVFIAFQVYFNRTTRESGFSFSRQTGPEVANLCDGGYYHQEHVFIPFVGCFFKDPTGEWGVFGWYRMEIISAGAK